MIKDIKLHNFISHSDTTLTFNRGITIFVGHNGSGKSSIIDAITFALFGEHTRKSNKNLVQRGYQSSSVSLNFSIGSREYVAYRQIGSSGQSTSAKFELISDPSNAANSINNKRIIISGERKQFGESMSAEIAKIVGMNYKKLRIAGIIQQGELNKIIETQPREFKELLNGLIGIDRLDLAYHTMNDVINGFRERLRDHNGGFDDKQIESIKKAIDKKVTDLSDAEQLLRQLKDQSNEVNTKLFALEREIERIEPLILQTRELNTIENALLKYVNEKRDCISSDVVKLERITKESRKSIQIVSEREEIKINLQMVKAEIDDVQQKILHNEGESGRLKGLLECSKRLEIKDGKCPVCTSTISTINKVFDSNHIQKEITTKINDQTNLVAERIKLKKEEFYLEDKEKKLNAAESFLASNYITSIYEIERLEQELDQKRSTLSKLPKSVTKVERDPMQLNIDDFSKSLAEKITEIREQVKDLKVQGYTDAKLNRTRLSNQLLDINTRIGVTQRCVQDAKETIDTSKKILAELENASIYLSMIENIRSSIFNRDGFVALSLRSWALKMISMKASDYAAMFNIGISRIDLKEKIRDIEVQCFGRQGEIDMDSLSGGEKVAVALALRLGIANIMGSNKLDFIILDEPTIHLDDERRKSLVKIILEAFREGLGPISQTVIITHDAEIFEDSNVDTIYRFVMSSNGSLVSAE
ncbi:MAG TPA: AAA family ATPase [Nitrososphaeraceae archaeon]|nr:AAA family ATPase [Nitrososphaeraceae archaeon]